MARPLLPACLAGALLLGGCASDNHNHDNGAHAAGGYRPWGGYYGSPWGGYYGAPYGWAYGAPPYYYGGHGHEHDDNDHYVAISPNGRFVQPEDKVVCDQLTQVCYRKGDLDASETRQYFGKDASHRADNIRDHLHDNDSFLPRPNVACSRDYEACYHTNGRADRPATRRFFGGQAARRQPGWW
jgi:hypothetical protein